MQQRLLGGILFKDYPVLDLKRIMARIRITEEVIADYDKGAFSRAMRQEMNEACRAFDAATHAWVKP